jgi:chitodextrinase
VCPARTPGVKRERVAAIRARLGRKIAGVVGLKRERRLDRDSPRSLDLMGRAVRIPLPALPTAPSHSRLMHIVRLSLLPCAALAVVLSCASAAAAVSSASEAAQIASDRIELRLDAAAAATARVAIPLASRAVRGDHLDHLGVAAVDRVAAELGGAWFEPEFRDETPPAAGSDEIDFTSFYVVHLPASVDARSAADRFRVLRETRSAETIAQLPVAAVPNDSIWGTSYWYYQASRLDMHAPEAWDITKGDTAIIVAILDTGLIPYHPDLGGTTAGSSGQLYTNWAEMNGLPGVDDDGNGFVDDVHGWDFVNFATGAGIATGEDWRDQDNDPNDFAGHGTAVAGFVGAISDNTIGVSGTAWNVRLMPLRMAWSAVCCPLGLVDMSFAAQAIRYATRMGAQIVNCSFSSANQSGLDAAVTAATHAGVTIVSAAGNNGGAHYLGDREDVIAVAATNRDDVVPSFSNTGAFVDLSAAGTSMYSTFITRGAGTDSLSYRVPAYTPYSQSLNGTSFSSPQAAGAVVLMQSQRRALGLRLLTPLGVNLRLRETTDDISAANPGLVGFYGTGRLNAYRALSDPPTSSAWRAGARSVGPTVAYSLGNGTRLAWIMNNQKLLIVDAASGDTLRLQSLPALCLGTIAGADLGAGRGLGLFMGTLNGKVLGYDAFGSVLPGWPRTGPSIFTGITGGPALGDLDGDGQPEIVCADDGGDVWAWHADGSPVAGFPFSTQPAGIGVGIALSDLDGAGGVDIIAATRDGWMHAIDGNGAELPGWPVSVGGAPVAPVIVRWGGVPVVLIAGGGQLTALRANGTPAFSHALIGTAAQDPALGDFNGDGSDEIAIATTSANQIQVIDSSGTDVPGLSWPAPLTAAPQGPPVIGHLRGGVDPDLLVMLTSGLVALSDSGTAIRGLPKPGGAGLQPTMLQLDADDGTEIAAGTGSDSSLIIYDVGPGSWSATPQPWPTPRGNFARTGSRLYAPALDATAPAGIADLTAAGIAPDSLALSWTAPGDDGVIGRAAAYEVHVSAVRPGGSPATSGLLVTGAPAPDSSGRAQSMRVGGLAPNTTWYAWVTARDEAGNVSVVSNVASALTPLGPPHVVTDVVAVTATDSSVTLKWTAPPATAGPVARYEVRAADHLLDAAGFASAPLVQWREALAAPGRAEAVTFFGLTRRTRYWFALRILDGEGQASPLSNVVSSETRPFGRLAGLMGAGIVARRQPSTRPVEFVWQSAGAPDQRISLFDLAGRRVRSLPLGSQRDGATTWDGRNDEGAIVPAGLYFARLISGSVHVQTRVVLLP